MVRSRRGHPSDDDDEDDEDEEVERPRRTSRRIARGPVPSRRHRERLGPVQRWRGPRGDDADDDEDEEEPQAVRSAAGRGSRTTGWKGTSRPPVFWRARDSLYFEPLVALAIVVLLIVGLYAFTQTWPPVYVVESDSMQHGTTDILGLINTGDLVLAQKVSVGSVVPYVVGLSTGYRTYGEYGDVLLYHPNGGGVTPVIHRAIVYLDWNSVTSSYSAPELNGLACGTPATAAYATQSIPGGAPGCATSNLRGSIQLFHVGWKSVNVTIDLSSSALGQHSGFVTMGDNNYAGCPSSCIDQSGASAAQISALVEPGWVVGVARGMIPWFGAVKLLLEGNAAEVPAQSWEFLALTLVGAILLGFGVHYVLRAEGNESPLRRAEEADDEDEEQGDDDDEPPRRRRIRGLASWRHRDADEEDPTERGDDLAASRRRDLPPAAGTVGRRGRPRPRVRRTERSRRRGKDEDL